jgi:hypothetical protein
VVLIGATPLLGLQGVVGAALALALAVWGARHSGRWLALAPVLGLGGGVVGVASAIGALLARGDEPLYAARAPFGWLALALALVAVVGGGVVVARPRLGAALLCLGSLLGFLAINLYDINTFYLFAPLACWAAAILALSLPATPRDGARSR